MDPKDETGEETSQVTGKARHEFHTYYKGFQEKDSEAKFNKPSSVALAENVETGKHSVKKGREVIAEDKFRRKGFSSPTKKEHDFDSGYSYKVDPKDKTSKKTSRFTGKARHGYDSYKDFEEMNPEVKFRKQSFVALAGNVETAKHLVKKGGEVTAEDNFLRKVYSSPTRKEHDFDSGYSYKVDPEDKAINRFETLLPYPQELDFPIGSTDYGRTSKNTSPIAGKARHGYDTYKDFKEMDSEVKAINRFETLLPYPQELDFPIGSTDYGRTSKNTSPIAGKARHGYDTYKDFKEMDSEVKFIMKELDYAAARGNFSAVKRLVERSAPLDAKDWGASVALHIAAKAGHVDIVKYLIENGAEVNAKDQRGRVALHIATAAGRVDIVKCLVENGAEVNVKNEGLRNYFGRDLYGLDRMERGSVALHMATKAGHVDIVKYLVQNGADVNAKDQLGSGALDMAVKAGHVDIVKYLKENGAEINAKDKRVALFTAAEAGHVDIVKYLVENGVEVDAKDKRGIAALLMAVRAGHYDIVEYFVENGAEVNAKDQGGRVALHMAIEAGRVNIVKYLVKNGAEVNAKDQGGSMALHMATKAEEVDIVKYLVENGGEVNAKDRGGSVALHMATRARRVDIVKYLVENGGEVNAKDQGERVALHMASAAGYADIVKYLVENGAEVNVKDQGGSVALHMAAEAGHVDIVKYLVENGAEVNTKNEGGSVALYMATKARHVDIVKYLVENGADVNADDQKGSVALHMATKAGHADIVKYLVENGAEVNAKNQGGSVPLHMATEAGRVDIVKYLVENGAEVNTKDQKGSVALHMAAKAGHADIVKYLVENGAEVNSKDQWGSGALDMAVEVVHVDIVKYLVENGAEVNGKDKRVALFTAAEAGHVDIVKYLVENGVEVDAKDKRGSVALYTAAEAGHVDIVKYLVENGAEVDAKDQRGIAALLMAARAGRYDIVKYLVESGAEVNAKDQVLENSFVPDVSRMRFGDSMGVGSVALHMAAEGGHVDIVKYLVENGAEVNVKNEGERAALHMAAEAGHVDIVKCLVENGAEVNAKDQFNGTALHLAAERGHVDVVKFLVENGAQVYAKDKFGTVPLGLARHGNVVKYLEDEHAKLLDAKDKSGKTSLHSAAEKGDLDCVKFLVEQRAPLNAQDMCGKTALDLATKVDVVKYLVEKGAQLQVQGKWCNVTLHKAAEVGQMNVVKCLVENGKQVNAKGENGEAALHRAARAGHVDVVKCLIENGALVNVKDKYGEVPLHDACRGGYVDIVKFLVEKGADLDARDRFNKIPLDVATDKKHDDVVNYFVDEGAKLHAKIKKINEVRSLAVQFTLANPCCIRVIPYENDETLSITVCLYVDTDDNGIPNDVKNTANEMFANCKTEYVDLHRRPLSKIVTRLPSYKKKKGKEIFDLSRKIEDNLYIFENRLNVTAVCASYKVAEAVEKEIPCVTVFVLGKGKIPAKETDIQTIKEDHGHLFDNAEFDVVEGYYRPAYGPDPWSQMGYARILRGGVGIGRQGILRAGTLGGFLEDENGECYILSCDHVLNPPKLNNIILSSNDCPNGVVDDAGTFAGLKNDVNNSSDGGPNGVVCGAGITAGLKEGESRRVEQPAEKDYDEMLETAKLEYQNVQTTYSDIANLTQAEKDDLKMDEYAEGRLEDFEKKDSRAQLKWQEIEKHKPRIIGEYVGGLKRHVKRKCGDETFTIFVDVAIAKLDKTQLKFITKDKADNKQNCCRVYGFDKIGNVVPTGGIVDLDTFVKEIRQDPKKLTFSKIGRTTGLTDNGQIETSFQTLCVKRDSFPSEKLLTSAMAHAPFTYCINCKASDVGEAELVANDCAKKECPTCGNDESEFYSSWQRNCFAFRQRKKPFSAAGDSGSLIFDNRGDAWGLIHAGMFSCGDADITLASPLCVALDALEKDFGKKLKLWCVKPAVNKTEESKREEPAINGTEESKCKELEKKETEESNCEETVVNGIEGSNCEEPVVNETKASKCDEPAVNETKGSKGEDARVNDTKKSKRKKPVNETEKSECEESEMKKLKTESDLPERFGKSCIISKQQQNNTS